MTGSDRASRMPPTRTAGLRSTVGKGLPQGVSVPLLLWNAADELTINPRHPAAWPARPLYALAVPFVVGCNVTDIAYRWWISREERAVLRRRGLLRR